MLVHFFQQSQQEEYIYIQPHYLSPTLSNSYSSLLCNQNTVGCLSPLQSLLKVCVQVQAEEGLNESFLRYQSFFPDLHLTPQAYELTMCIGDL